jgi:hypothetical protein
MQEVGQEIEAKLRKEGTFGKFGFGGTFSHLKKEELRTRGIEWQSVEELNPGAIFD